MTNVTIEWCAGFFDGEGSFSFSSKSPVITVVNTNPIAVSAFATCMLQNNIVFKISERSKPSKSSKKKRWDLYLSNKDNICAFLKLMKNKIIGKNLQLNLMNNFYDDRQYNSYYNKIQDYNELMKYFNQTNNILIIDENKLIEKLGGLPEIKMHKCADKNNTIIIPNKIGLNIDYFAGIIDAEGSIVMNTRESKRSSNDRYTPVISIVNTNVEIIRECCSILKQNNIGYHVQCRYPLNRNRVRFDVMISGIKRVYKLSNLLKNKLIIKNRQNDLLLQYCEMRLIDLNSFNNIGDSFKESIEALNKEN